MVVQVHGVRAAEELTLNLNPNLNLNNTNLT